MMLLRSHHFQIPVVIFVVPGPPLLCSKKWMVVGVDDELAGDVAVGVVVVAVAYFVVVLLVTVAWVAVAIVVVLRQ